MEFKTARLDRPALFTTIITSIFLIFLALLTFSNAPYSWLVSILMFLILVISYLLSPKCYVFEGSKLVIEKVIGTKITIPIGEIESYVFVPNFMKLKPLRLFGNGGLFGYYGFFTTPDYGSVNCQLRSLKNVFIIKSRRGSYAISPRETAKFEEHLKTVVTGITGKLEQLTPLKPAATKKATLLIMIVPDIIFCVTILALILLYPQLPERIATHFNLRGVPDGWGSKGSFLAFSIIASSLLLVLNFVLFFIFRARGAGSKMTNFSVFLLSFTQIFVGFLLFDSSWFNIHKSHIVQFPYLLGGFFVVLVSALLFYYCILKRHNFRIV